MLIHCVDSWFSLIYSGLLEHVRYLYFVCSLHYSHKHYIANHNYEIWIIELAVCVLFAVFTTFSLFSSCNFSELTRLLIFIFNVSPSRYPFSNIIGFGSITVCETTA